MTTPMSSTEGTLLIGGEWLPAVSGRTEEVRSPYDGRLVGTAAVADAADVDRALAAAERGAAVWRETPAWERNDVMMRAAALVEQRVDELAALLTSENGKPIFESRGEVGRAADMIRLAAYEGTQLYGDTLPLDANRGTGQEKIGFTLRQPVGIVVAITPFNYPSLLVLHKIAPAIAAGNAVVLKPARATPLTALALARAFTDAGLPDGVLNVVTGSGGTLGDLLVADPRVRKVSFTGSTTVGEHIARTAGVKKLSLELGASCPVVVLPDADLELTARAIALGGFINAGQVCISVQRVITTPEVHGDLMDALVPAVEAIQLGDPSAEATRLGALINEGEAKRVEGALQKAVAEGGRLLTGGQRDGAVISPAIVDGVAPDASLNQDELFGPAVAVSTADDWAAAIAQANSTPYGLGTGVFTRDVSGAVRAMRQIDSGVIHINWTPLWRADLMPYGGLKASGIGKEGFRTAVEEMTEVKTIILHGEPW